MWKRPEAPHPPVNSRTDNNHLQEHHSPGADQKNHPTDPQNYELKKSDYCFSYKALWYIANSN